MPCLNIRYQLIDSGAFRDVLPADTLVRRNILKEQPNKEATRTSQTIFFHNIKHFYCISGKGAFCFM